MLKWIGLMLLGAILIAGSCYRWDRVSDSGVISQETCRDNPVPGCKNPEDFKDSIVVDSVTGDTTQITQEMFSGKPNGLGWIWFVLGLSALGFGGYRLVQEVRARRAAADAERHGTRRTDLPAFLPWPLLAYQIESSAVAVLDSAERSADNFGWAFWLVTLGGLIGLGVLWWKGHADLIDRPDPAGTKRGLWNAHSKFHLIYAAVISAFVTIFDGPSAGIISAVVLGLAVELFQKWPRDGQGGMIEVMDIIWDVAGALGGALVATIVMCGALNASWC